MDPESYEVKKTFEGTIPEGVEAFFGREVHHLHPFCLSNLKIGLLDDYGNCVESINL